MEKFDLQCFTEDTTAAASASSDVTAVDTSSTDSVKTIVSEIVAEIVTAVQTETSNVLSEATRKKIEHWTEEIATTDSDFVKFRDELYIILASGASLTVINAVKKALSKLS
ncbi:Hypothetical protein LUCI_0296 [Lucifera butyrica]|uniref:Uncharacterized protein n=1 Tax=Lucifera butyrica TaxID=1351585 RepID=A0A498R2U0_9FIRM|nr:hypothetical protein [Lucifera butyrica]VBB05090.1 Hypothetical protein LUCI_0296 [Lucifera butyrica]